MESYILWLASFTQSNAFFTCVEHLLHFIAELYFTRYAMVFLSIIQLSMDIWLCARHCVVYFFTYLEKMTKSRMFPKIVVQFSILTSKLWQLQGSADMVGDLLLGPKSAPVTHHCATIWLQSEQPEAAYIYFLVVSVSQKSRGGFDWIWGTTSFYNITL